MKNKFDFYDVVLVSSTKSKLSEITNTEGVILGMAQNEETDNWGYSVSMYVDSDLCWHVMEEDLIATGKRAKEEDFYSGESVRVRVDPETGEGEIADD